MLQSSELSVYRDGKVGSQILRRELQLSNFEETKAQMRVLAEAYWWTELMHLTSVYAERQK